MTPKQKQMCNVTINLSFAKSASAELELPINMQCRFYCLYLLLLLHEDLLHALVC